MAVRKLIAFVGALGLAAPVVTAGVYQTQRDTFMRGSDDVYRGTATTGRTAKYNNLSFYLADFDRAAIVSEVKTLVGKSAGDSLTLADMALVNLVWSVKPNYGAEGETPAVEQTYLDNTYKPTVFLSQQDWVEASATNNFAIFVAALDPNNKPYVNPAGTAVANAFDGSLRPSSVRNVAAEVWGGTAADPSDLTGATFQAPPFRNWSLDDAVELAFLTDPNSRGLTLLDASGTFGPNLENYSREAAAANQPFLTVSAVPEPASLSLLALGGLALLRRRGR